MASPGMWMGKNSQTGTAAGEGIEAEGNAGVGEPTPTRDTAGMSDEGNYNTAAQAALAASRGRPAITDGPDNFGGGEILSADPTKAEGGLGLQEYPHYGAPTRTVATGPTGNDMENGDGGL